MSETGKETHNPWLGLETYEEKYVKEDGYKFCGREEEVRTFAQMIDYELVNTIYGKSGIGKSSLLQAGVFPLLPQMGYTPFWIRFDNKSNIPFAKQTINIIAERAIPIPNIQEKNEDDILVLWRYLHSHKFHDKDNQNKEAIPVLVFDQFEEVFLQSGNRALDFLCQLYALISNSYIIPEGYIRDNNFRIVFSLREDYLYLLEEAIDKKNLTLFKNNRFRLKSLEPSQAKSIILEPGEGVVEEKNREIIANKIIEHLSDNGEISTQMVSLACYQLYDKAAKLNKTNPTIALDMVDNKTDIEASLTDFYIIHRKKLKHSERRYIHRNLIANGHRKLVPLKEFEANVAHHQYLMDNKIVHVYHSQTNKDPQVEIIHDQIASVIEQEESRINKKNNIGFFIAIIVLFSIFAIGLKIRDNQKVILSNPIPFAAEDFIGKVIGWEGRPYEITGGHLTLRDCRVQPYAFPNGWEIDTLSIMGVQLSENSITNGNIRVLDINGTGNNIVFLTEGAFAYDSLETVIISGSDASINTKTQLGLRNLHHIFFESEKLKLVNGTLFGLLGDGSWQVLLSRHGTVYYDSSIMAVKRGINIYPYKVYDISTKHKEENTRNGYYLVTSSDPNKTSVSKADMPPGTIVGVDLPDVMTIDDETFHGNMQACQFISIPKVRRIGKSNFIDWMPELDSVTLPDTVYADNEYNWINIFGSTQFLDKEKTFGKTSIIGIIDSTTYIWDNVSKGFNRTSDINNNTYNRQVSKLPDSAQGYHYSSYSERIVFDSDYVFIPIKESHPILEDSLKIIPGTIVIEKSSLLKDYAHYMLSNNILYYRTSQENNVWKPILTLNNSKPTLLNFQTNLQEQAFGGSKFIVLGSTKYNLPAGDTLIVPYGQTAFYKRLYGNSYTIQELSFHKSKKLFKESMRQSTNLLAPAHTSDANHLKIGSKTMVIDNSLISSDYFDYPPISSVSIDIRNDRFSKRGNIIYDLRGNAIHSINNGEPVVLDGFQALGNKKIHSGTYILLREDAIFPEPSLIDGEKYIIKVPFGKAEYYSGFAGNDSIEVVEMGRIRSFGWRLWDWASRVHRITLPDRGNYIWSWRSVVFVWIIYAVLIVLCSIIASRLIRGRKWVVWTIVGIAVAIPLCHYFIAYPAAIFNAITSFAAFFILDATIVCLLFKKRGTSLAILAPILLLLTSCNPTITDNDKLDYIPIKKGDYYGVINRDGKQIVPFGYDDVWMDGDDMIKVRRGMYYGMYDTSGIMILPCRFENAGLHVTVDNVAYIRIGNNGKYGIIKSDRNIVIPIQHNNIDIIKSDGKVFFCLDNDKTKYYNIDNPLIEIDLNEYAHIDYAKNGDETMLIVKKDTLWGVIDFTGQYVIPPIYQSIQHLRLDDTDCLKVMDSYGNWGVLNYDNDTLIPFQRSEISYHDYTHFLITDENGQLSVSDLRHLWNLSNVSHPYFICTPSDTSGFLTYKDGKEGLVDIYNNILIPFKYDTITSFGDAQGYYLAKEAEAWTLIDNHGYTLFVNHYDSIKIAKNNTSDSPLIAAKKGGRWGIVDRNNNIIVPFQYKDIKLSSLLLICTDTNDNRIAINHKGKIIVTQQEKTSLDNRGFLLFVYNSDNDGYHKKYRFDVYLPSGKRLKNYRTESYHSSVFYKNWNKKQYISLGKKRSFGRMRYWLIDNDGIVQARNCKSVHWWQTGDKSVLVVQKRNRIYTFPLSR